MAAFKWNGWQLWRGIGGRFALEYALNRTFETGRKVAEDFKKNMRIQFEEYLPQWNYVAVPALVADISICYRLS